MTVKKNVLFLIIIFALVAGYSLHAGSLAQKEMMVQPGQKLEINLRSGGNLTLKGWKENKVRLEVVYTSNNMDDWNIKLKKVSDGVYLEAEYIGPKHKNHGSPRFEINVPGTFDAKIKSMGGAIVIKDIKGEFTGKTMGGKLDLSGLKGFVNLKTMGGAITLKDSDVDGKVKTMGGRVLLENVMGDVSGSSMGGNVIYKNVKSRDGKSTGQVVNISTMGGAINVNEALHGANVHTMGGDIHVKKVKEFINAKTMGGEIRIDDIDGWVKATTMGGDINVTMTGDPAKGKRDVYLSSKGGDISLTVPKGLDMDIDIKIVYTRGSKRNYSISGDFNLDIQQSSEWEDSHGSPFKTITGKGTQGKGTHKITINTVNGNVFLKKD